VNVRRARNQNGSGEKRETFEEIPRRAIEAAGNAR
jgi:hypothetical protein